MKKRLAPANSRVFGYENDRLANAMLSTRVPLHYSRLGMRHHQTIQIPISKFHNNAKNQASSAFSANTPGIWGFKFFWMLDVGCWNFCVLLLGLLICLPSHSLAQLPDAAGHIGTIVINNNDQFTTSLNVSLAVNAVDDGNGVV